MVPVAPTVKIACVQGFNNTYASAANTGTDNKLRRTGSPTIVCAVLVMFTMNR